MSHEGFYKLANRATQNPIAKEADMLDNLAAAPTMASSNEERAKINELLGSVFDPRRAVIKRYENGWDMSCQLNLGLLRTGKLLPPDITYDIEIQLADFEKCCAWVGANNDQSYELSNVRMVMDTCKLHPAYVARYQQEISSNGSGVVLEFDTYQLFQHVLQSGSNEYTVLLNRAISNLRGVYSFMEKQAPGASEDKNCAFPYNDFRRARWMLNGRSYPVDWIEGPNEAFDQLMKSMGGLNDYSASSLLTYDTYVNGYSGYYSIVAGKAGPPYQFKPPQGFVLGLDFQKSMTAQNSGVDTAMEGGVMQETLQLNSPLAANHILNSVLHFSKALTIAGNSVAISE